MKIDLEALREQYASLSDEALSEIQRGDLIADAQRIYDEELAQRQPAAGQMATDVDAEFLVDEDDADWLDDAAEIFSVRDLPGNVPAPEALKARDVLLAARIPCHLELTEDDPGSPDSNPHWRVLVPGHLNLYATNVLDRDIYNEEFEADWKTHLQAFSDQELRAMNPQHVFCGLFDRVERAKNAYAEELARRNLQP